MMKLLVYSEVRLFGQSLALIIRRDPVFEAVLVYHDEHGLEERILLGEPDVVLFDVSSSATLKVLDLLANRPGVPPIVAVAVPATAEHVMACAEAGVCSIVHRDASLEDLKNALTQASSGETVFRPDTTRMLFTEIRGRRLASRGDGEVPHLTSREADVLRLVASGESNKQIARELHLSVSTVKKHLHSVFQKLQLERRSQARKLLDEKPWILTVTK